MEECICIPDIVVNFQADPLQELVIPGAGVLPQPNIDHLIPANTAVIPARDIINETEREERELEGQCVGAEGSSREHAGGVPPRRNRQREKEKEDMRGEKERHEREEQEDKSVTDTAQQDAPRHRTSLTPDHRRRSREPPLPPPPVNSPMVQGLNGLILLLALIMGLVLWF